MLWTVEGLDDVVKPKREKPAVDQPEEGAAGGSNGKQLDKTSQGKKRKKKKKVVIDKLTPEELEEFTAEQESRGIVYISRIPPFMKPDKVRREMSQHGRVMRVFLTPEARSSHLKRKRYKGNSKINYTDGWVEFADKKDAKTVALALNAQPVGGKKRGYYHDDLWNLKYLPGFKWRHLTESVTQVRMERADKLQAELAQAKKERGWYLAKVEQAKGIAMKEDRLEEKGRLKETAAEKGRKRPARTVRQRQAVAEDAESEAWIKSAGAGVIRKGDAATKEPRGGKQTKKKRRKDSSGSSDADNDAQGSAKRRRGSGANCFARCVHQNAPVLIVP
eukprot:COSAG02_NODE_143_length_34133_cov_272.981282_29_plen_333_part_00